MTKGAFKGLAKFASKSIKDFIAKNAEIGWLILSVTEDIV